MTQCDFFTPAPTPKVPFQRHSATSRAAAAKIADRLNPLQIAVLQFIVQRGALGATDEEIQAGCTMNPNTERPRRIELAAKGLIADSGTTRKTRSGRAAVVWVVR